MPLALGLGLSLVYGGAAFSPLSLSPSLWLDPSDLTTLFQDSAGTTPVTANNDPVGRINDKSGNGRHLIQATAAARPLYKTSGGLSWLEFDGTDDFLKAGAFTLNQPHARVIAARHITWVLGDGLWDGNTTISALVFAETASPRLDANAGGNITIPNAVVGTDMVITEEWNGVNSRFAVDNNAYATGNQGALAAGGFTLGARGSNLQNSNIRFSGGVIFNRALLDAEIAQLRTYLAAKQGRSL